MKKITLFLCMLFLSSSLFSQRLTKHSIAPIQRTCGTAEPSQKWENWLQSKIKERENLPASQRNTIYDIPVIVHIIHNGESVGSQTNISDAQINSQFDVLNEDFRKLNTDNNNLPGVWQGVAADVELNFCPATVDPSGNTLTTPGINRINRSTAGFTSPPYSSTYMDNTIKPNTIWNPNNYLNIWVANMSGGLLGYATWPPNSGLPGIGSSNQGTMTDDGVVILYNAFGRVGSLIPQYNKGRTATHEIGHWVGLRHIWGDSNCGTDYCNDTPTQQSSNFGCPNWPSTSNCSGNAPNGDMFYNFMDYSDDNCLITFTEDQKTRIQTAMSNSPMRSALANSTACGPVISVPVANFSANTTTIQVGGTVNFSDLSANSPTSWNWTFNGGNPGNSSMQNPLNITYNTVGCYDVTLVASNANGTDTETKICYINVVPVGSTLCDTVSNFLPTNTPSLTPSAYWGYIAGHNFYDDRAKADRFDAPPSGYNIEGLIVDIGVAHAGSNSSSVEFKVWSENGTAPGASAGSVNKLINSISTASPSTMMFASPIAMTTPYYAGLEFATNNIPQDTIAIRHSAPGENVPGTAWEQWSDNTWHAFTEYPASWGLDVSLAVYPILCTFTTGIEESSEIHFDIYPNPANNYIVLHTHELNSSLASMQITDMLGKVVLEKSWNNKKVINEKIDLPDLTSGLYLVELISGDKSITKKLVIE